MKQIATITGGEAFLPARPGRAATSCKRIAQITRNVYTIGYSPSSEQPEWKIPIDPGQSFEVSLAGAGRANSHRLHGKIARQGIWTPTGTR